MTTEILGLLRPEGALRSVHLERSYGTDPADLWSALTEPERLARWFARVDGDLVLGGDFVILFDLEDAAQQTPGTVLECDPPRHLLVSWVVGELASRVSVELTGPDESGRTTLVLDHVGLASDQAAGYGAGWQAYLEALEVDLDGGSGRGPEWDDRWRELLPAYQDQAAALT
jgi:uncharacterized protein YndB with AHSA1/START domain